MTSGLHVHEMHLVHGFLHVTIATSEGRDITVALEPDDHPGLAAASERFQETVVAAAQTVMLDVLGMSNVEAVIPDNLEGLGPSCVVPCRICGVPVDVPPFSDEERAEVFRTTYCPVHG